MNEAPSDNYFILEPDRGLSNTTEDKLTIELKECETGENVYNTLHENDRRSKEMDENAYSHFVDFNDRVFTVWLCEYSEQSSKWFITLCFIAIAWHFKVLKGWSKHHLEWGRTKTKQTSTNLYASETEVCMFVSTRRVRRVFKRIGSYKCVV